MTIAPCYLLPNLPDALAGLAELALDLRWSWSHAADVLWERIAPELWQATRNPWLILQNVSNEVLNRLAQDQAFVTLLNRFLAGHRQSLTAKNWFSSRLFDISSG
jgi:starch phosphorylase